MQTPRNIRKCKLEKVTPFQIMLDISKLNKNFFMDWNIFRGAAWEDAFLDLIEEKQDKLNIFEHIRIARFASRTLDHELEKNTKSVVPYFTSTFAIMAIFSVGESYQY